MHEFAAFEKAPVLFPLERACAKHGRRARYAISNSRFLCNGSRRRHEQHQNLRRTGPKIRAKSIWYHDPNLAYQNSVLGTTDRGPEQETHRENGTPKHGQEVTAITWVKYQKNIRPKNFQKLDPNGRVKILDRSFYLDSNCSIRPLGIKKQNNKRRIDQPAAGEIF